MPKARSAQTIESDEASRTEESEVRSRRITPRPQGAPDDRGPVVDQQHLPGAIEAILLTAERPLSPGKIAEALRLEADGATKTINAIVEELNRAYDQSGRSFRIENVAGGYRVMTCSEFAPAVAAFKGMRERQKLSRAAIETLAIVAYKQPITRAQIEAIRGVATGDVLRGLLERRLIAITGRAEELGRPMLYGTSKLFLETFGLSSPKDLPPVGDLLAVSDPEKAPSGPTRTPEASAPAEPNDQLEEDR